MERLILELKVNFGVRVSDYIKKNRDAEEVRAAAATIYVMLGGSNCDRLGDTLVAMGKTVLKMYSLDCTQNVLLMGLDNGSCYEEGEEETRLKCITCCASNFPLSLLSKTITKFFYFLFSCFAFL